MSVNRCRLCPSRRRPIMGEGPEQVQVMIIGEQPGKEEDRRRDRDGTGHPFIGDSGKELRHHYLPIAGLRDKAVYITNTVKCLDEMSLGNPGPELARCCSDEFLPREIRYHQPEVIVTLGAVAARTLFPGLDLERNHGLPIRAKYRDWEGVLLPMYHPAAGLRDGRFMGMLDAGFKVLGEYLRGERPAIDLESPRKPVDYWDVTGMGEAGEEWLEWYLALAPEPVVAVDTETSRVIVDPDERNGWRLMPYRSRPYSVSLSVEPGTAAVFRAEDRRLVQALKRWVDCHRALVVFHNEPFDAPVLQELGLDYGYRFTDTMMEAYHINLPQSLKALAWRLCGFVMDEFEDVARPHSLVMVRDWVTRILASLNDGGVLDDAPVLDPLTIAGGDWTLLLEGVRKMSIRKTIREWAKAFNVELSQYKGMAVVSREYPEAAEEFASLISKAKHGWEPTLRKLTKLRTDLDDGLEDPWERWNEAWNDQDKALCLERGNTPMPPLDIAWTPWEANVAYSGADADGTLRIWPEIRRRASGFRRSLWR